MAPPEAEPREDVSEAAPGAGGDPQGRQAGELVLGKPAPSVVMGRHLEGVHSRSLIQRKGGRNVDLQIIGGAGLEATNAVHVLDL